MFNFVVRADEEYSVEESRFFEFTDDSISRSLKDLDGSINYEKLATFPTLMIPELGNDNRDAIARVGYVSADELYDLAPSPFIHPFPADELRAVQSKLGIREWEFNRTHWAVKNGDLYRILSRLESLQGSHGSITFPVVSETDSKVAVMMPFNPAYDHVYEVIKRTVEDTGRHCLRVDEMYTPTSITEDIYRIIEESRTVIADISGLNPNVMYELGLAHGRGKRVIILANDIEKLPFDITTQRVIFYSRGEKNIEEMGFKLELFLNSYR